MNITRTSSERNQLYINKRSNDNKVKAATDQVSFKGVFMTIPPDQVPLACFAFFTDILLGSSPFILKGIQKLLHKK